ncbi:MAG: ATP-binding protein [Bacteroidales bacterium]|nr:ATP-binding protein [Bacteroidales bacterium]
MEKVLLIQNKHWSDGAYKNLYNRQIVDSILNKSELKEIQILLGVRRSGKSTIFKLLINHLIEQVNPKEILNINIDDPVYFEVWNKPQELYKIIERAEKLTGVKIKYLFLDEIQNVSNSEKFIKSVYDSELFKKIYITGSNSVLLQGNYAKLLTGRYIIDFVYPLSFKELLKVNKISEKLKLYNNKSKVLVLLDDMIDYGSFPEIIKIKSRELRRELLISYFEAIVMKDCIFNHKIREARMLKELAFYLVSNISSVFSYLSLSKATFQNENSLKSYVNILTDSFLLYESTNFSYSLKQNSKPKRKIYCIDNGMPAQLAYKFTDNKGRLFENLVYTELIKKGLEEIYFYNENKECDFIIKKGKDLIAIQVAYELNEQNRAREIKSLEYSMDKLKINKAYIITYNIKEELNDRIEVVPFWLFFSGFYF